jgi:uncharacterized membrane-anchored protein YitT (DUF2179 family)
MEEMNVSENTEIKENAVQENVETEVAPAQATAPVMTLPRKLTKADFDHTKRKRDKFLIWLKAIVYTLLSAFCIAFAADTLLGPNKFTIGGATGISVLIYEATGGENGGFSKAITLACINVPLVVLSFFFVKKKFAILSALNIGAQNLFMLLFENFVDLEIVFPGGEPSKIFAAIASGLLVGLAISLAFKVGGSTGGADILSVMIQRKIKSNSISTILFTINCIVIGSSIFVFKPEGDIDEALKVGSMLMPIVLAAFEAFMEIRTYEALLNGSLSAVEFRIITDKPDEMANAIMHELSRGVTAIPATGMYTKITHTMLVCVVSKRLVTTLQRIMKTVDPDSFAITTKATQVLGLGFYRTEN